MSLYVRSVADAREVGSILLDAVRGLTGAALSWLFNDQDPTEDLGDGGPQA